MQHTKLLAARPRNTQTVHPNQKLAEVIAEVREQTDQADLEEAYRYADRLRSFLEMKLLTRLIKLSTQQRAEYQQREVIALEHDKRKADALSALEQQAETTAADIERLYTLLRFARED